MLADRSRYQAVTQMIINSVEMVEMSMFCVGYKFPIQTQGRGSYVKVC